MIEKSGEAYVMPTTGFIRASNLVKVLGISSPTLYRWMDTGVFPKSVQIGPKATGWNVDVVRTWIDARSSGGAA
ncbi:MAG: AlpA family phage regulatory protein [Paraburkholderia sp.]|uniref:helix-turn-helix transcriptional regulator n=1 Tax=Paraburkholderia sp. TaxID=1926495 RepID=UPI0012179D5B|nr:AlpA family phage regulatory protein [Paraburkholderia sp.]TAM06381.1 MAG: AlpA family phage regulatory protein [Paraburkholderia sp.]